MNRDSVKIGLIMNQVLQREGLQKLISDQPGFDATLVADGLSADEIGTVLNNSLSVLVVDLATISFDFRLIKQVRTQFPELPIVVLIESCVESHVANAFHFGAEAVVTKKSHFSSLLEGVQSVLAGSRYFSQDLSDVMIKQATNPNRPKRIDEALSSREQEVLFGILNGKSNTNIARNLGISEKTVSTYKTRIFEKLNVKNTAELFRIALKQEAHLR